MNFRRSLPKFMAVLSVPGPLSPLAVPWMQAVNESSRKLLALLMVAACFVRRSRPRPSRIPRRFGSAVLSVSADDVPGAPRLRPVQPSVIAVLPLLARGLSLPVALKVTPSTSSQESLA